LARSEPGGAFAEVSATEELFASVIDFINIEIAPEKTAQGRCSYHPVPLDKTLQLCPFSFTTDIIRLREDWGLLTIDHLIGEQCYIMAQ
jgi:hypothetical protein